MICVCVSSFSQGGPLGNNSLLFVEGVTLLFQQHQSSLVVGVKDLDVCNPNLTRTEDLLDLILILQSLMRIERKVL